MWRDPKSTVLTFNLVIQTSDKRFSIVRPYESDWSLRITNVQSKDAGNYSCVAVVDGKMPSTQYAVLNVLREYLLPFYIPMKEIMTLGKKKGSPFKYSSQGIVLCLV